jgi:hypothetical protein
MVTFGRNGQMGGKISTLVLSTLAEVCKESVVSRCLHPRVSAFADRLMYPTASLPRTVREDHARLKVEKEAVIYSCYAHLEADPHFHRRCYWLIKSPRVILVHYLRCEKPHRKCEAPTIHDTATFFKVEPDTRPQRMPAVGETLCSRCKTAVPVVHSPLDVHTDFLAPAVHSTVESSAPGPAVASSDLMVGGPFTAAPESSVSFAYPPVSTSSNGAGSRVDCSLLDDSGMEMDGLGLTTTRAHRLPPLQPLGAALDVDALFQPPMMANMTLRDYCPRSSPLQVCPATRLNLRAPRHCSISSLSLFTHHSPYPFASLLLLLLPLIHCMPTAGWTASTSDWRL